ncbi:hypothetical protein A1353_11680 [Methylomonas methanica]|uniref:Uncharacterized protein n=1 Tax=Methylomonas methanica TaxID=421 RepID=A0A177MIQ1_METMH|nr:hypothetical protein A1353_11680 [Methylomonas methanica]
MTLFARIWRVLVESDFRALARRLSLGSYCFLANKESWSFRGSVIKLELGNQREAMKTKLGLMTDTAGAFADVIAPPKQRVRSSVGIYYRTSSVSNGTDEAIQAGVWAR